MSWWWVTLALAAPLEDWVTDTRTAWEAVTTEQHDGAQLAAEICHTTVEAPGGLLRVDDKSCEALRRRLAAGDESARIPLALHLRTLAAEGRALARTLEARPTAAVRPPTPDARPAPAAPPVDAAGQAVGQASAGLREAAAERWRQQRAPGDGPPRQGVVLALAVASLVAFVFALLVQRRLPAPAVPPPPAPVLPSFPQTPEGQLRHRYVRWLARLTASADLPWRHRSDEELHAVLPPEQARLLRRASTAIAPVAYGGAPATGERRGEMSWVEESL